MPVPANDAMGVDLTIIVVNYNTAHLLRPMLDALRASTGSVTWEVVIIDNASRDDSKTVIQELFPDSVQIFNDVNVGFGRANNQALPHIRGRHALLLNTDAFVAPDTLERTAAFMDQNPDIGILGVRLIGTSGDLQPSCRYFPTPLNIFVGRLGLQRVFPNVKMVDDMGWDHRSARDCDWVPGCYYLVRRTVLEQVGLFDPRFFMYFEEVDHCRRVKADGWRVVFFPNTKVVHLGGESAKSDGELTKTGKQISELQIESELLYVRKHFGFFGQLLHIALTEIVMILRFMRSLGLSRASSQVKVHREQHRKFWRMIILTKLGLLSTK